MPNGFQNKMQFNDKVREHIDKGPNEFMFFLADQLYELTTDVNTHFTSLESQICHSCEEQKKACATEKKELHNKQNDLWWRWVRSCPWYILGPTMVAIVMLIADLALNIYQMR